MTDPSTIASRLSEAQRAMIASAERYGDWWLVRFAGMGMDARYYRERRQELQKAGLTLYWNPHYDSLTRPGLAVRALISED